MVSRYMVLFGISCLRLDIFITWLMSIFQSTIVSWHFISQFVRRHILGRTTFSKGTRPFSRLSFTFRHNYRPSWFEWWGIPPCLSSLDLQQVSLPFNILSTLTRLILGHTPFFEIIRSLVDFIAFWSNCRFLWVIILEHIPFCVEFVCIIISSILWLQAIWSDHHHDSSVLSLA